MTDTAMLHHETGTVEDAKQYLRSMINQGMRVAFAGSGGPRSVTLWITCWELPSEFPDQPVWPDGVAPIFERVHLGCLRSEDA
jgi:hypothetical protein